MFSKGGAYRVRCIISSRKNKCNKKYLQKEVFCFQVGLNEEKQITFVIAYN
jgi:hypothetical protein